MLPRFVKHWQQVFSKTSCNRYESRRILEQFSENGINFCNMFICSLLELLKFTVTKRLLKSGRYQIGDDRFFYDSHRHGIGLKKAQFRRIELFLDCGSRIVNIDFSIHYNFTVTLFVTLHSKTSLLSAFLSYSRWHRPAQGIQSSKRQSEGDIPVTGKDIAF